MYAFGHGLSYTTFGYRDIDVTGGDTVPVRFTVTTIGPAGRTDCRIWSPGAPAGCRHVMTSLQVLISVKAIEAGLW